MAQKQAAREELAAAPEVKCGSLQFMLPYVQQDGLLLKYASLGLQSHADLVRAAVQQNGLALQYASPSLQADRDIALLAVENCGQSLQWVNSRLQHDKELVSTAVLSDAQALRWAGQDLCNDQMVVEAAVNSHWQALQFASEDLKSKIEIVRLAVDQNGEALKWAPGKLKGNKELVLKALETHPDAFDMAPQHLQQDKDVIVKLPTTHYKIQGSLGDASVMLEMVKKSPLLLKDMTPGLRANIEIVSAAVSIQGVVLRFADEELKSNKEIVMLAVSQNGEALRYASDSLRGDLTIVQAAISSSSGALRLVKSPLHPLNPELLKIAGLTGDSSNDPNHKKYASGQRLITVSERYGLAAPCSPISTLFMTELEEHLEGNERPMLNRFKVYNPNLVSKGFCGFSKRRITDSAWPCRGECILLGRNWYCGRLANSLSCQGCCAMSFQRPNDRTCWRTSFRWHQQKSRDTGGFMLQIVEADDILRFEYGAGQLIEVEMADIVNLKTFCVYVLDGRSITITKCVNELLKAVEAWLNEGENSCALTEICKPLASRQGGDPEEDTVGNIRDGNEASESDEEAIEDDRSNSNMDIEALEQAICDGDVAKVVILVSRGVDVNGINDDDETMLMLAAKTDNMAILEHLLTQRAEVNQANRYGETALLKSVMSPNRMDTEAIRMLMSHSSDIEKKDSSGKTALMHAASWQDCNLLNTLVEAGALLEAQDENGNSALAAATYFEDVEAVKVLVKQKANIMACCYGQPSILSYARSMATTTMSPESTEILTVLTATANVASD